MAGTADDDDGTPKTAPSTRGGSRSRRTRSTTAKKKKAVTISEDANAAAASAASAAAPSTLKPDKAAVISPVVEGTRSARKKKAAAAAVAVGEDEPEREIDETPGGKEKKKRKKTPAKKTQSAKQEVHERDGEEGEEGMTGPSPVATRSGRKKKTTKKDDNEEDEAVATPKAAASTTKKKKRGQEADGEPNEGAAAVAEDAATDEQRGPLVAEAEAEVAFKTPEGKRRRKASQKSEEKDRHRGGDVDVDATAAAAAAEVTGSPAARADDEEPGAAAADATEEQQATEAGAAEMAASKAPKAKKRRVMMQKSKKMKKEQKQRDGGGADADETPKKRKTKKKKRKSKGDKKKQRRDDTGDAPAAAAAAEVEAEAAPGASTPRSAGQAPPPPASSPDASDDGTARPVTPIAPNQEEAESYASSPPPKPKPPPAPLVVPPKPQLEVSVHRVRNLDYVPRGITHLASTPPGGSEFSSSSYVAVAREGGSVDLLAVDEKWRCVASVPGLREREVDALAWTCGGGCRGGGDGADEDNDDHHGVASDGGTTTGRITYSCEEHMRTDKAHSRRRLFGSSRDGTIFEVDFGTKRHVRVTVTGGGGVFCLASLCPECGGGGGGDDGGSGAGRRQGWCGGYLAAGCEDGSVRIYRAGGGDPSSSSSFSSAIYTADGTDAAASSLELVATLPSAGKAVLSLAWRRGNGAGATADAEDGGIGGSVLYAGIADGTIRRFDCVPSVASARASGSAAHAISTGSVLTAGAAAPSSQRRSTSSQGFRWRATNRMTVETLGRRAPTRIWALEALSDGTVVSGDSLGHVQFWDGASGTLMSKFVQNENGADVLDLAVSQNECKVFASGVDSRVVCIERRAPHPPLRQQRVADGGGGSSSKRDDAAPAAAAAAATAAPRHPTASKWVQTQAQRPHTHDVKGLCICRMRDPLGAAGGQAPASSSSDPYEDRELLCSGGVDTKLCTYLVSKFRQYRAKKVFPWPPLSPVSMARGPRILSLMRSDRVDLYQLGPRADVASASVPRIMDEDKCHLGSIEISSPYNLICADISDDGKFLAASDAAGLLLFSLTYEDETDKAKAIKIAVPAKLNLPGSARMPCTAVKFAPDSSGLLFCATALGPIHVLRIADNGANDEENMVEDQEEPPMKVIVEHTFKEHVAIGTDARPYPITELAASPDARWLAAGRSAMGSGAIHVFELQATEGAPSSTSSRQSERRHFRHWWSVPAMEAPHSCIKFLGGGEVDSALAVGCSNNCFYILDLDRRCLSDWSQDAGFPISSSLPKELIHRADYPVRLVFNSATPNKFLLGAHGFFCIIDLDLPVPKHSNIFPPNHVRARRFVPRKPRSGSTSEDGSGADADGSSLPLTRKRKRTLSNADMERGRHQNNFTVCLRYSGMLFMDFLADDEMVVVEQPWMNVVNALPDALERRVYGR